ncbi:MAG: hypothetical protein KM312_08830 [Hydrogenibacillus schlegelii]|uniref:Uncharacterized protein n=1 Tax=Hydrogenibacillus schlegelii TaxID=1484 RepID=A0A947G9R7_HYDSH|nr:hypothetical protein [Hydrogenibacillus schlegelii]
MNGFGGAKALRKSRRTIRLTVRDGETVKQRLALVFNWLVVVLGILWFWFWYEPRYAGVVALAIALAVGSIALVIRRER